MMKRNVILLFCLLLSATLFMAAAGGDDRYGWPEQKAPEKLCVQKFHHQFLLSQCQVLNFYP